MNDTDWDLAEGLDPEGPSADDLDRFGDEIIACASCGRDVYDQAEVCPYCGGFVHKTRRAASPWMMIAVAVVILAILLVWVF